ncbi:MAG: hypothetical protein IKL92_04925 [Oscillospiraceae bacterium]|nr:hypothetical protein [Oscillospiraceae bacterium]
MAYVKSTAGVFDDPSMYKGEIQGITDDPSSYKGSTTTVKAPTVKTTTPSPAKAATTKKTTTRKTTAKKSSSGSYNAYTSADAESDAAQIASLEWQSEGLKRAASDAARQAYISRMMAERDLDQKLAAEGSTGGMSESARLRLKSGYEAERGKILRDLQDDLGGIKTKIATVSIKSKAAGVNLESYVKKYRKLYEDLEKEINQSFKA